MADVAENQEVPLARQAWFRRRSSWVALAVIAVLIIGGVGVYKAVHYLQTRTTAYQQSIKKADEAYSKGKYKVALVELKKAEAKATTKSQKVDVYNKEALAAASDGQVKVALAYLEKKHKLDSSSKEADAQMMAGLYERLGDTKKAEGFYKKAITYLESLPQNDVRDRDIESLKAYVENINAPPAPEAPTSAP